ncbi:hypothetical protein K7X08_019565 [Anisodus acutangulus]|uniref:F-box/LRR-repeat protein 15/At3g58940/PEG3-like LRR domain-containing protein n=1 Tax=Anisodus acutangulus TaxID=402998 RepID=A0A9Q1RPL4_9SOLA|nr:hypothetical protein K7X08_019565 [Anisodus acutangulus]
MGEQHQSPGGSYGDDGNSEGLSEECADTSGIDWITDEDDEPYSLPQVFCSSSSILKFECWKCRISEDCVLNWTSLKSLTLGYLYLTDEHIEQIMSNCPQLESLKLCSFCGFSRLYITSPKCRQLQLIDPDHPEGDLDEIIGETIVKDLLVSVRCANELMVSSWCIKVIYDLMLEEEDVSLPLLE